MIGAGVTGLTTAFEILEQWIVAKMIHQRVDRLAEARRLAMGDLDLRPRRGDQLVERAQADVVLRGERGVGLIGLIDWPCPTLLGR